jgi:hypothetical protein
MRVSLLLSCILPFSVQDTSFVVQLARMIPKAIKASKSLMCLFIELVFLIIRW